MNLIRSFKAFSGVLLVLLLGIGLCSPTAVAEDAEFVMGKNSLVNTGKDNGYSGRDLVDKDDPHWGWEMGDFLVSGFTRVTENNHGTTVLLKNVGDTVTLSFDLSQDIDNLNDSEKLSVSEDKNGWDQKFGVEQQNFGRGMLIVKQTNHKNESNTELYRDFLAAEGSQGADTEVKVFEEGDYEVALDYEIKRPRVDVFGWKPAYSYSNYQVSFKFSVRNGNNMVFPIDLATGSELVNEASTEDGFRLDLAKSRYLDIDLKRATLNAGADGLVEDTRFNRPARDGSEYTDEGVYTITVRNRYTDSETVKTIYVGTDTILKAHAKTGLPLSEIKTMLDTGATIADDGSLILANATSAESEINESLDATAEESTAADQDKTDVVDPLEPTNDVADESERSGNGTVAFIVILSIIGALLLLAAIFFYRRSQGISNRRTDQAEA
ncbi:hypothetical protein AALI21_13065 [Corynebacteriaceae bacterium 6-324]